MKKTAISFLLISFVLISNFAKAQSTHVTFYTNMGNFEASLYDVARPITTPIFWD